MKRFIGSTGILFLLSAGLSTALQAQTPAGSESATKEPEALNALKEMAKYLLTLKDFQVRGAITDEIVLVDGQKIQVAKTTNLLARLPDRLMVDIDGDQGAKIYFYNGKEFSIFAKDLGYYASAPTAARTLKDLVNALDDKYGVEIPLADLFLWGDGDEAGLTSAIDFGPSDVDEITCEHYAYRQEGLDWQVWIEEGSHPLPLKLVLTTTTDEARPQHEAIMKWNLAPSYDEAAFTFDPPAGSHKIIFATADADAKK
jgi:hypothetical protein